MHKKFRRIIAFLMAFVLLVPNTAFAAEENYVYVPEIELDGLDREQNLFWLASSEIEMEENSGGHYLVKIGRGGDLSEASVTVKIGDVTARYGKDYRVYLYDGGLFGEAEKDKDSLSVMDMIEGEDYTEFEISDTEELIKEIEDGAISDSAIAANIGRGLNEAIAENKAAKGEDNSAYVEAADSVVILDQPDEENENSSETSDSADEGAETSENSDDTDEGKIEATVLDDNGGESETEVSTEPASEGEMTEDEGDKPDLDTLAGAKEAFTGIKSDRIKPKASMDIIDQFEQLQAYQDLADTISDSMINALLTVDFDEGESEKYIEIVPINNDESDSTRIFNLTIGDPQGQYTVSAYSTAVAKILDDEEPVRAKVSIGDANIITKDGKEYAEVTLTREGGMNDLVSVTLKSRSQTAMSGRDFSPVFAEVVFPFGVTERKVQVPVNTQYITGEAVFDLYIDTPVSCEIGERDTTQAILLPSEKNGDTPSANSSSDTEDDNNAQLMGDSEYQANARVYFPRVVLRTADCIESKDDGFVGDVGYNGDYEVYMNPDDDDHRVYRVYGINNEPIQDRFDVNGFTCSYNVDYASSVFSDGYGMVAYRAFDSGFNINSIYGVSGLSNGWHEKTYYFSSRQSAVSAVGFGAWNTDASGANIKFRGTDLYPLKRQFKIELQPAVTMPLRNADGSVTNFQPTASVGNKMTTLQGVDAVDTNSLAYRTSGEILTVDVNGNDYFNFVGLEAVDSKGNTMKIPSTVTNSSATFTLTNDLLKSLIYRDGQYKYDFVTLTDRSGGGCYGNIKIRPVFEYRDRHIYVEKNTQFENTVGINIYNQFGSLSVNGKEHILGDNQQYVEIFPDDDIGKVWHYGDEFRVKTNASHPDIASAAGVGYRTGTTLENMNTERYDVRVSGGSYDFKRSVSDDIFKNETVAFYPLYTQKKNGLTLMLRKSDVDNHLLDTSYGILSNFDTKKAIIDTRKENGKDVEYYQYLMFDGDLQTDRYYDLMARAVDGYAIKWVDEGGSDAVYSGNTLYYMAKGLDKSENVVRISAEKDGVVYVKFKGSLKYNIYNASSKLYEEKTAPLPNAISNVGPLAAFADDGGNWETATPGIFLDGTDTMQRITADNKYTYNLYSINVSNKKVATVSNESFNTDSVKYNTSQKNFTTGTQTITTDVYTMNMGTYTLKSPNSGTYISNVKIYSGNDTVYEENVMIDGEVHTFVADVCVAEGDKVKSITFLICDPDTNKTKYEITAKEGDNPNQWVGTEKLDTIMLGTYSPGDTIFAVMSTSDSAGTETTHLPVYTGCDLTMGDEAYDFYQPQNFNLPTTADFISLPVLDKLASGFDFPFVSVSLEQRPTGEYRMKIGVNVTDIIDAAADTTLNKKQNDAGLLITDGIDWDHPVKDLSARAETAYNAIFKKSLKSTPLLDGTNYKLGPTQFRFSVMVGGYIDFGEIKTTYDGKEVSDFVLTGGGGYIGVSITFKKNFYFLICGTVPAYIGGSASGTLMGNMGATKKNNTVISVSSMKDQSLDLQDGEQFNGNLNASASVALYAGVGLEGVLGAKVEGKADLSFLWEPLAKQTYAMNDEPDEIVDGDYSNAKIHNVGFTVAFKLGGEVDLLLFSIPVMYEFDPINTGFNEDIRNAHVRRGTAPEVSVDGSTKPTDAYAHLEDGWYYIRNAGNNKYMNITGDGKIEFISRPKEFSESMALYVTHEGGNYSTWYIRTDQVGKSKYLTFDNSQSGLARAKLVSSDTEPIEGRLSLQEPNLNDFNIISTQLPNNKNYLMLNEADEAVFDASGAVTRQLWRFEPVNDTVEALPTGWYDIRSAKENIIISADFDNGIITPSAKPSNINDNAEVNKKWYIRRTSDNMYEFSCGYYEKSDERVNETPFFTMTDTTYRLENRNYLNYSRWSSNNLTISPIASQFYIEGLPGGKYRILPDEYASPGTPADRKVYLTWNKGTLKFDAAAADMNTQSWTFEPVDTPRSTYTDRVTVRKDGRRTVSTVNTDTNAADSLNAVLSSAIAYNDMGVSETNNNSDIAVKSYKDKNDYGDENVRLRERDDDSQWVADKGISLLSGFKAKDETTLIKDCYERPETQIADLGGGDYMIVFVDTDSSRGLLERTALKYAVYRDGRWSEPVVIQNDITADFQPSITDAGENIAVAWTSSDPEAEKTGDATQYLTTMEVYTTLINKTTGEIGEITRLTNDAYYDYAPKIVYDSATGDMAVYYIKTTVGDSFLDTANSFTNDCLITYMLYDNNKGKWLTDYYYPEEVADPDSVDELIKNWGGQRFLPAPITDLDMDDPLIVDFTAIGYNGLAVYGYTIDKDNDSSTNEDRDLFVQVYDFTTHKNHPPIRITNDGSGTDGSNMTEHADTMPQFVRAGGSDGHTYLYWFRNDTRLANIDISELAHDGLNDDGTIKSDYELDFSTVDINLPPSMKLGSSEAYATMSYYRVCVDKDDNIYIVWVDLDRETQKQEVFASARIKDAETGESAYSDAYQLTHSEKDNEEPAFLVDDEGNMIVVATRYNSELTDNPTEPLKITDLELVSTVFEPYGELYAEDIEISDLTPEPGETVEVKAKLYNRGLTAAKGYTLDMVEMKGDQQIRTIDTIKSEEHINPGKYADISYNWTAPSDLDGVSLGIRATEAGMPNFSLAQSDELKLSPDILLDSLSITQEKDGFSLSAMATNNGNASTSDSDNINVVYYPEKAPASMLGIKDETFAKIPVGGIAPGETKPINIMIDNINGRTFNAYGYLPVLTAVTNADGDIISNDVRSYMLMDKPIDLSINNTDHIVIKEGEAVDLALTYEPAERFGDVEPAYYTNDIGTASVIDGQLVGVSTGKTTLTASAQPYGSSTQIEVEVIPGEKAPEGDITEGTTEATTAPHSTGGGSGGGSGGSGGRSVSAAAKTTEAETEATTQSEPKNSEQPTGAERTESMVDKFIDISQHWGRDIINSVAERNIVSGYEDKTFRPDRSITRAEFLTILYNSRLADTTNAADDISFADISGSEWYYDYIRWGAANGLIVGYDDNTFRGNNIISRQEMAVVISKFVELADIAPDKGEAVVFDDAADIAPWAKEYVDNISACGIVQGDDNNRFLPRKDLTRAETAVIIDKLTK